MSDKSKIDWTDATWNPVVGCSHASPGCDHCYAERLAGRLEAMGQARYMGLTRDRRWTGEVRCVPEALDQPLHWRAPRAVFVCSMGDLFHEAVPFEFIAAVFGVMAATPHHTYQVLTKRPERMREFFSWIRLHGPKDSPVGWTWQTQIQSPRTTGHAPWPLPHVWLGTTVEDQRRADERVPHLLECPAAVRFVSVEPMLGAIELTDHLRGCHLDWVICGGETGPGARPMHPDWARGLRDQCSAAGVPFYFKQWGAWLAVDQPWRQDNPKPRADGERWLNLAGGHGYHGDEVWRMRRVGKARAGHMLDGREHREMPEVRHV